MSKYKSVLVSLRWVVARRKRKCYHSKTHIIVKGDKCLEVHSGRAWPGYCEACATEMIENGMQTLTALRDTSV